MGETAFGNRLRELRTAAKLTQQELAKRSGLARITIAQLETGVRQPAWATVQVLTRALGVDCRAFAVEEEERPAKKGKGAK